MSQPNSIDRSRVRPFAEQDRQAVLDILLSSDPWKRLGYEAADWDTYFSALTHGREGYVLELDGRVAGFAVLRPRFLFGDYLELFGVAGWARGQQLGSQLLTHLESVTFSRGTNLFACVSDFNLSARQFYKKHGYQEVGAIKDFLIPGSAEILVRKTVGPARVR
ncbi:MAG: N-acetyltransferase family protein [Nitrospiraceae bacterium]